MCKTRFNLGLLAALMCSTPSWSQGLFGFGASASGPEADVQAVQADARTLFATQDDWMRPFMQALYRDGEWGSVLNLERLGLAAMEKGRLPLARKSFDEAIQRVEAIYANDANAAKARSVFNEEKVKDFKGEPYERAMLYYYRGLLYAQEGDYENARAAFLAADRHDTLSSAEDQAYVGKFGLMKYLAGWAAQCAGDTVRTAQLVEEARAADPKMQGLPSRPGAALVLIDAGPAPVKWGDGQYKHILKFKAGEGEDPPVALRNNAGLIVGGDLVYQATTRGGREIDGVLAGKAQFKDTAGTVGTAALVGGSQAAMVGGMSGNRDVAGAGLAFMVVGLIAKGVEQASNPEADLRSWDSLPAQILVAMPSSQPAEASGFTVGSSPRSFAMVARQGKCSVAWGRTRSALTTDMGGTVQIREGSGVEANRGDRNRAFRAMVITEIVATK